MALVNQVNKKVQMKLWDIVKYQILTYCYINQISVSDADLECLTLLAINGEQELTQFCNMVHYEEIFKSTQNVRNVFSKAEKKNLIVKEGKSKKKILLNPELNIVTKGNILLDFKFLAVASN